MKRTGRLVDWRAAACVCAVLAGACRSEQRGSPSVAPPESSATKPGASTIAPPEGLGLQTVTLPDLSSMNESARGQMQARSASLLARIADRRATPSDLGSAYGEMGKLLKSII